MKKFATDIVLGIILYFIYFWVWSDVGDMENVNKPMEHLKMVANRDGMSVGNMLLKDLGMCIAFLGVVIFVTTGNAKRLLTNMGIGLGLIIVANVFPAKFVTTMFILSLVVDVILVVAVLRVIRKNRSEQEQTINNYEQWKKTKGL